MTSDHDVTAPRVAVLVFNDAGNDSRVLKESASLAAQGYQVRIVAVERRKKDHPAGRTMLEDGRVLQRVPEFAFERILPGLAPVWRRLVHSDAAAPVSPAGTPASPDPSADGPQYPDTSLGTSTATETDAPASPVPAPRRQGLVARARSAALGAVVDVGDRVYRTLSLGTYWFGATRAATTFAPDVVHANDGNTLVPALLIKAMSAGRTRIVYDSHELWRHRNVSADRLLAPLVEALSETLGIHAADAVITVSGSIARWLQTTYHLPSPPVLVRNVPAADDAPDRSTGILRERAGLTPQDKVIAYGGRITSSRGIEETIAALPHLHDDVHFVLLGYGEPEALGTVRAEARAHGVSDRVHLVGAVAPDQVSRALADGDVAVVHVRPVCLSYEYALPNKLFESIRAGLPIAAADLPDMREVVEQWGVGEVFRGESPEDLASALQDILDDPTEYQARARDAAPHLTWEHEADALLGVYRQVLDGHHPATEGEGTAGPSSRGGAA
jgi:glycosyltransferase involved in cell wall biosynthesis